MKKLLYLLILSSFFSQAWGQAYTPEIKNGTTFSYTFYLHGQQASLDLTVQRFTDTLFLTWNIRGLAGGTYVITPAAINNAGKMNFAQPVPGTAVKLADDETFCMISKKAFTHLIKTQRLVYDNTVYNFKDDAKENPVMFDGQALDLLHVTAQDETTELWILNNPDFPLVCKIKGSVLGIDCLLKSVKQPQSRP